MVDSLLLTPTPLLGLWSSWYPPLKCCHHSQSCFLPGMLMGFLSLHSQETYRLSQTPQPVWVIPPLASPTHG